MNRTCTWTQRTPVHSTAHAGTCQHISNNHFTCSSSCANFHVCNHDLSWFSNVPAGYKHGNILIIARHTPNNPARAGTSQNNSSYLGSSISSSWPSTMQDFFARMSMQDMTDQDAHKQCNQDLKTTKVRIDARDHDKLPALALRFVTCCPSLALCLLFLCSLFALRLLSVGFMFAPNLLFGRTSFAHRLLFVCSLFALRVFFVCSWFSLRVFIVCSLFALCSSFVLRLLIVCSLFAPHLLFACY